MKKISIVLLFIFTCFTSYSTNNIISPPSGGSYTTVRMNCPATIVNGEIWVGNRIGCITGSSGCESSSCN